MPDHDHADGCSTPGRRRYRVSDEVVDSYARVDRLQQSDEVDQERLAGFVEARQVTRRDVPRLGSVLSFGTVASPLRGGADASRLWPLYRPVAGGAAVGTDPTVGTGMPCGCTVACGAATGCGCFSSFHFIHRMVATINQARIRKVRNWVMARPESSHRPSAMLGMKRNQRAALCRPVWMGATRPGARRAGRHWRSRHRWRGPRRLPRPDSRNSELESRLARRIGQRLHATVVAIA